jgi:hypothetical protein
MSWSEVYTALGTHTTTLMKRKEVMPPSTQSGIDVMTGRHATERICHC